MPPSARHQSHYKGHLGACADEHSPSGDCMQDGAGICGLHTCALCVRMLPRTFSAGKHGLDARSQAVEDSGGWTTFSYPAQALTPACTYMHLQPPGVAMGGWPGHRQQLGGCAACCTALHCTAASCPCLPSPLSLLKLASSQQTYNAIHTPPACPACPPARRPRLSHCRRPVATTSPSSRACSSALTTSTPSLRA